MAGGAMTRSLVHAIGRVLTRVLLHPRWRHSRVMSSLYLGLYLTGKQITERREVLILRRLLVPGMVVADIGANVGFYTLQIAAAVGPAGRVLAFEPDPFCYALLADRVTRARATNVTTHQLGIGDADKEIVLYTSSYNRADNRMHRSHGEPHVEAYQVRIRRLDDVLSDAALPKFDALKIDVQGAEEWVLRGAEKVIHAGLRWIWIEFSPQHLAGAGTDPQAFLTLLAGLGMSVYEVGDRGDLQPLSDSADYVQRIGTGYGDLLLLSEPFAARITSDPPLKS